MTIQDMHYDFKKKLNKVDSQGNRNLLIPEIDWALNEALTLFVKNNASPRIRNHAGFEKSQRFTDDLYPLVIKDFPLQVTDNRVILPQDYMFYVKSDVLMDKGNCYNTLGRVQIQQQDDKFEEDPFNKSSFEWRVVNGVFTSEGIRLYTDNTFSISTLLLSYIKKHNYIHFAEGLGSDGYVLPSGKELRGKEDCILPEHTHSEIVDIAVALVSGEMGLPDYQVKMNKLQINQFQ